MAGIALVERTHADPLDGGIAPRAQGLSSRHPDASNRFILATAREAPVMPVSADALLLLRADAPGRIAARERLRRSRDAMPSKLIGFAMANPR
jgi:hypothetical protein